MPKAKTKSKAKAKTKATPEFYAWIEKEAVRVEAGGSMPDEFRGSREDCLRSFREEVAQLRGGNIELHERRWSGPAEFDRKYPRDCAKQFAAYARKRKG